MEPADVKDVIDEAIERAEGAAQAAEKFFRDRVSILVGVFAVLLAVIHVAAAGAAREGIVGTIQASDTYGYMQAKIIRETVLTTGAAALPPPERAAMLAQAARLRAPDRAGHGIRQLQASADAARERAEQSAARGERFEWAETALQVAIVLLSIALVARSRPIVGGAVLLAALGGAIALWTALG